MFDNKSRAVKIPEKPSDLIQIARLSINNQDTSEGNSIVLEKKQFNSINTIDENKMIDDEKVSLNHRSVASSAKKDKKELRF